MSAGKFTGPERSAQVRQAKRYRAAIEKKGLCSACKHRDKSETFWGRSVCRVGQHRMHPQCDRDGKGVVFVFDETVLDQFKDAT